MDALRTAAVMDIESTIEDTAKRMIGFMGRSAVENVRIRFGFSDPANPFQSLRIQYEEGSLHIPAEEIGLGIQSAIVVGIFETLRSRSESGGVILIEEPELYLHPQAQRYFYNLLSSISQECQLIYSTHSPIFADVQNFESLRLFKKEPSKSTTLTFVSESYRAILKSKRSTQKFAASFAIGANELCFARRVLLVEGPGDRLAVTLACQKMCLDLDAEGFSVIACGGKNNISFYMLICKALSIPFLVLHDEDIWTTPLDLSVDKRNQMELENQKQLKCNLEISQIAGPEPVFVCTPSLESELSIGRTAAEKPSQNR